MKISLVPYAGLCNRMNAIICGLSVNEETAAEIDILWPVTHDCNINFSEIFKNIDREGIRLKRLRNPLYTPALRRNLFIPKLLRKLIRGPFDAVLDGSSTTGISSSQLIEGHNHLLIHSCNRFCLHPELKNIGNIFHPTDEIEERIERVLDTFGKRTLGMHIRRTDNSVSIKNSPIKLFEEVIEKEIAKEPDTKFYIATDDASTASYLYIKYPNNVLPPQKDKILKRGSKEGMKQAVVDLYSLARTSGIYGSNGSTFSIMAAQLYNIPLTILKLEE